MGPAFVLEPGFSCVAHLYYSACLSNYKKLVRQRNAAQSRIGNEGKSMQEVRKAEGKFMQEIWKAEVSKFMQEAGRLSKQVYRLTGVLTGAYVQP